MVDSTTHEENPAPTREEEEAPERRPEKDGRADEDPEFFAHTLRRHGIHGLKLRELLKRKNRTVH